MKIVGAAGYDFALRERIVAAVEGGMAVKDAARVFSVNVMTVYRYLKSHRMGQLHVVAKPTGRPFQLTALHEAQLLKQLEAHSDATLFEHARSSHGPEGQRQDGRPGLRSAAHHV